jgi:hypothetical protein
MNHALKHEERQNKAIRTLAQAVSGLASEAGKSGYKVLVEQVEKLLTEDEAEPEAPPAPVEAPTADPAVPSSPDEPTDPLAESK